MKTIGLVGYGSFGKLLHTIISENLPELSVKIYSHEHSESHAIDDLSTCDLLVIAVPISQFKKCLQDLKKHISSNACVMDVCSVKAYPKQVMLDELATTNHIVCSHPMFGPATYSQRAKHSNKHQEALKVVLENVRSDSDIYQKVYRFWETLGLKVVEMSAEEHDRLAAKFHFTALSVAQILKPLELEPSLINTGSAEALFKFLQMISTDSQLLKDIYEYNPYCHDQHQQLITAFDKYKKIFKASS